MNEFVRNLEAELGKGRRPVLQLDQEEAEDEENARPVRVTDETPEGPPDTNNDAEEERYEPTELEVLAPENADPEGESAPSDDAKEERHEPTGPAAGIVSACCASTSMGTCCTCGLRITDEPEGEGVPGGIVCPGGSPPGARVHVRPPPPVHG